MNKKTVFITFDQAHYPHVISLLEKAGCRGFTAWEDVRGRGSVSGEPHYGSHAWPSMASAVLTVVDGEKVPLVLEQLRELDRESPKLGLRAFVWNVEEMI